MTRETLWQTELEGLEASIQLSLAPPETPASSMESGAKEAKKSLAYLLATALEYGRMGSYAELLDRVAAFPRYSPYNALLVMLQRPAAKFVLPAHQWSERYGRRILPNQQPLVLLQPGGPLMYLFDVSQTEGTASSPPLPPFARDPFAMSAVADAENALYWIAENAKWDGVRVLPTDRGWDHAGAIWAAEAGLQQNAYGKAKRYHTVSVRYETLLNQSHSHTTRLATLAHELGHLYCGHVGTHDKELWPDRRFVSTEMAELEAESVARVVFGRRYPGVELPDHLTQYFTEVPELRGLDLERVLTAAGRILETADGFRPRRMKSKKVPAAQTP
ncbi:hypothetical protein N865_19235 [Intrasporangium oryzae NRRL B-24470]|uniref:IrrE N-terminal-like domain-containing protein n=1 Tax=Intrasporangium oryzae NRRL B-24470 TaxID=1386089 RepID=W9GDT0_9MICO|nr:ImmA/IrrE family metallo-endopeptidase [Intrasporangium oryzae]EWT03377.1 hypothetical protein N865_19235 [Intrasporangium oryzae NRRL B-24470]